jgi:hypothetical protein
MDGERSRGRAAVGKNGVETEPGTKRAGAGTFFEDRPERERELGQSEAGTTFAQAAIAPSFVGVAKEIRGVNRFMGEESACLFVAQNDKQAGLIYGNGGADGTRVGNGVGEIGRWIHIRDRCRTSASGSDGDEDAGATWRRGATCVPSKNGLIEHLGSR